MPRQGVTPTDGLDGKTWKWLHQELNDSMLSNSDQSKSLVEPSIRGKGQPFLPELISVQLQSKLLLGEKPIWVGKPSRVLPEDRILVLVGTITTLIGAAFAIMMIVLRHRIDGLPSGKSSFAWNASIWFGWGLTLAGLTLMGPLRARRKARYVLTNHRVFLWQAGLIGASNLTIILPEEFTCVSIVREKRGRGDLILIREFISDGLDIEHGFFSIENVRDVAELLVSTLGPKINPALLKGLRERIISIDPRFEVGYHQ